MVSYPLELGCGWLSMSLDTEREAKVTSRNNIGGKAVYKLTCLEKTYFNYKVFSFTIFISVA